MYVYHLRPHHKLQARKLGVIIRPATKSPFKIDVFSRDTGEYLTSIGDRKYKDYMLYVEEDGYDVAERRRELYWKRHGKTAKVPGSRSFFAAHILW
jgi:hypothetical protein